MPTRPHSLEIEWVHRERLVAGRAAVLRGRVGSPTGETGVGREAAREAARATANFVPKVAVRMAATVRAAMARHVAKPTAMSRRGKPTAIGRHGKSMATGRRGKRRTATSHCAIR